MSNFDNYFQLYGFALAISEYVKEKQIFYRNEFVLKEISGLVDTCVSLSFIVNPEPTKSISLE
jgi:hypothetical protein